jgi:hypothetical protein
MRGWAARYIPLTNSEHRREQRSRIFFGRELDVDRCRLDLIFFHSGYLPFSNGAASPSRVERGLHSDPSATDRPQLFPTSDEVSISHRAP